MNDKQPYTVIPHRDLADLPEVQDALAKLCAQNRSERATARTGTNLTQLGHKLLAVAVTDPWAPGAVWWRNMEGSYSWVMQKKVVGELKAHDMVDFVDIRLGRANVLLVRLLDRAYQHLGLELPRHNTGRGGIAHQSISHWLVLDGTKRGLQGQVEWTCPGTTHACDAALQEAEGRWHVYEVVVDCSDNLPSHLHTIAQCSAVAGVTIVCTQRRVVAQLQNQLKEEAVVQEMSGRLTWDLAETFMRRLWS